MSLFEVQRLSARGQLNPEPDKNPSCGAINLKAGKDMVLAVCVHLLRCSSGIEVLYDEPSE